jgi:hypothetical protein
LSEKNGECGARKNWKMKRGSGGCSESFRRKRTGGSALSGRGSDGGGGSEGGSSAENCADIAGILDTSEDYQKRSRTRNGGTEDVVERKFARFDEGGDSLGMFSVGDALEETVRCVKNGESDFGTIEIRSEASVMTAAGLGEEHGFDTAARVEGFFGETNTFDADCSGFGGKSTAQSNTKFFQPAIFARGDDRIGAGGSAGGRHE